MSLKGSNRGTRIAIARCVAVLGCGLSCGSLPARAVDCAQPPVAVAAVAPEFPDVAHRAKISGTVAVAVTIDEAGKVASAHVKSESGAGSMFVEAAVNAAKRWQFNPAVACGSRQAMLTFDFKLPIPSAADVGTVFRPPYTIEIVVEAIHSIIDYSGTP